MATRRHKAELEGRRFDDGWKDEADLAGWGPFDAEAATVAHTAPDFAEVWRLPTVGFDDDGRVDHYDRVVDPDEYVATVLRHDLTADRTTFTTPDLYRVIAARQGQGVTIDTIERVAARFVASDQVIAVASSDGQRRWTSREILDTEQHLIAHLQRNHTHRPLPPNSIATAAAHRTLGGEVAPPSWTPNYGRSPMEGRPLWAVQRSTRSSSGVTLSSLSGLLAGR